MRNEVPDTGDFIIYLTTGFLNYTPRVKLRYYVAALLRLPSDVYVRRLYTLGLVELCLVELYLVKRRYYEWCWEKRELIVERSTREVPQVYLVVG